MTPNTAWLLLSLAGLLEVVWAIAMKYSEGFTRLVPSLITLAFAWSSFWLLSVALKVLPVGTAYAVWTGIGAVGAALVGIVVLKEPANAARIVCIVMIVSGIVGLKLFSSQH